MNPHSHSVPVKYTIHNTLAGCVSTQALVPACCTMCASVSAALCVLEDTCTVSIYECDRVCSPAVYSVCSCIQISTTCANSRTTLTHQCCSVTSSLFDCRLLKTQWVYGQFETKCMRVLSAKEFESSK